MEDEDGHGWRMMVMEGVEEEDGDEVWRTEKGN